MRALAINVAANTTLPGFRGPVWPDGSFEYVPIPEREPTSEPVPTYGDLAADLGWRTDVSSVADTDVHLDPEFPEAAGERYTYGDEHGVKASPIADLDRGDWLLFYATLTRHGDPDRIPDRDPGEPAASQPPEWGAYLIGAMRVDRVATGDEYRALDPDEREPWRTNAHVRRETFDARVLVRGDGTDSRLFDRAIPISAPSGGADPNLVVTEWSADSGKGPWWRRPLRFDPDATGDLLALLDDHGV